MAPFGFAAVETAPQFGLPQLALGQIRQRFALLPSLQPVGTVHQILVEHIGQLSGQRITRALSPLQISAQRPAGSLKALVRGKLRPVKQGQQPPAQHFRRKRIVFRHRADLLAQPAPHQLRRQRKAHIGGNAGFSGKIMAEKTAHPVAGHHHFFGGKGIGQRILTAHRRQQRGKVFQMVGLVKMEHGAAGKGKGKDGL